MARPDGRARPRPSPTSRPSRRSRTSARSARCPARSSTPSTSTATRRRIDACAGSSRPHSLGLRPAVITGVGFCMLMRREAIEVLRRLRRGDLRPGLRRGGRLLPAGVAARFLATSSRTRRSCSTTVAAPSAPVGRPGWPGVRPCSTAATASSAPTNRRERVEDPLAVPFAALELALDARDPSRPQVLHVLHSSPGALGGTEKHLRTLIEALGDEFDASILFPVDAGFVLRTRLVHRRGRAGRARARCCRARPAGSASSSTRWRREALATVARPWTSSTRSTSTT